MSVTVLLLVLPFCFVHLDVDLDCLHHSAQWQSVCLSVWRVCGTEEEHSLLKAEVKHYFTWSPIG